MFFAGIHVHSCRLAGTITEYRLLSTRRPHPASHTLSAHWLGDGSHVHGFQSLLSLSKTQAFRCLQTLSSPPDGQSPSAAPPAASMFRSCSNSQWRSESTDGIGPTPMPATQPHPLVRVEHTTSTSKGKTMNNEIQPFEFRCACMTTLDKSIEADTGHE